MISIPPPTLNFACTAFSIMGSIDFPARSGVSKFGSVAENKQFLSRPLVVNLNRLHESTFPLVPQIVWLFS